MGNERVWVRTKDALIVRLAKDCPLRLQFCLDDIEWTGGYAGNKATSSTSWRCFVCRWQVWWEKERRAHRSCCLRSIFSRLVASVFPAKRGWLRCGMLSERFTLQRWSLCSSPRPQSVLAEQPRFLPTQPDHISQHIAPPSALISLLSTMVKVLLNNVVIAESDSPVTLEGNYYFPPDSVKKDKFSSSSTS